MSKLTAIQALALSKIPAGDARDELSPGDYSGQVTVTVDYDLRIGEDYEQNIVQSAKPWDLVAVLLSKLNGVTIESVVREAESGDVDVKAVKAGAKAAMAAIKAKTSKTCNGKVTGDVTVVGTMITP